MTKRFGAFTALDDVSMKVEAGAFQQEVDVVDAVAAVTGDVEALVKALAGFSEQVFSSRF